MFHDNIELDTSVSVFMSYYHQTPASEHVALTCSQIRHMRAYINILSFVSQVLVGSAVRAHPLPVSAWRQTPFDPTKSKPDSTLNFKSQSRRSTCWPHLSASRQLGPAPRPWYWRKPGSTWSMPATVPAVWSQHRGHFEGIDEDRADRARKCHLRCEQSRK